MHKPALIYGDGGIGKSTLSMQLGACKSAQKDWLGLRAQPGRTSISAPKATNQDELHFRLDCIRADTGLRWSDLADVHFQLL